MQRPLASYCRSAIFFAEKTYIKDLEIMPCRLHPNFPYGKNSHNPDDNSNFSMGAEWYKNKNLYLLNNLCYCKMKISFSPNSNLGKCSIGLIVMMPILFYIGIPFVSFYESVPAGKTIPHDIVARPGVAIPMLAGFVSGITSFFCGIIGISRKKDYSILVFISTMIGFFVLLFILAEILFPH